MESQNGLSELPSFTPTREQISQCGRHPVKTPYDQWERKNALDERIVKEADRRFGATMALVDPGPYLVGEPPEIPTPTGYMKYDYEKLERLREGHYWDMMDWEQTRDSVLASELDDEYVHDFLRQTVAIRIISNQLRDQYSAESKSFNLSSQDPLVQKIEAQYQEEVTAALDRVKRQFHLKNYRKELVEDPETGEETEEDFYIRESTINEIEVAKYTKLAEAIADKCATNSYLESLFQVFVPVAIRDKMQHYQDPPKPVNEPAKENPLTKWRIAPQPEVALITADQPAIKSLYQLNPNRVIPEAGMQLDALLDAETIDVRQIPYGVPFAFLGGGLSLLHYQERQGDAWKTYQWEKPIPPKYQFGAVYVRTPDNKTYKKTGANKQQVWQWKEVDLEKEKIERQKTVRPPWKIKKYFEPEKFKDASRINDDLNRQGWTRFIQGDHINSEVEIPEDLGMEETEPLITDRSLRSYILYDPERAEVARERLRRRIGQPDRDWEAEGWEGENLGYNGHLYVRTKPEAWNIK